MIGDAKAAADYGRLWRRRWRHEALNAQTCRAIVLCFGIVPPDEAPEVGGAPAALVEAAHGRIATDLLGTSLVLPALMATGGLDVAYRLLLNERCPGWLYQFRCGGATMWERWDAVRDNGSLHHGDVAAPQGASMISPNHYAYGAVADWLYRAVAGIRPAAPGYRQIGFAPRPGGGLSRAAASVSTPYDRTVIAWRLIGDRYELECDVPPARRET